MKHKILIGGLGTFIAGCIVGLFVIPTATKETPQFGWQSKPEETAAIRESLPFGQRYFSETPAGKAVLGNEEDDIFLTDAALSVRGDFLPIRDQGQIGSCVSFGTTTAIEHLILIQIAEASRLGIPPPTEYRDLAQEIMYGGSRVEIGGGRIRGDGSVTAWAAKFAQEYGVVARDKYDGLDLTTYSVTTCRKLGASGVSSAMEAVAKKSPVKSFTFVRSAAEASKALHQLYPIAVGSSQGFGNSGPWNTDSLGRLKASGTWGHCMAVLGVAKLSDGKKYFLFENSWSDKVHQGPKGGKNVPKSGVFFVDWDTADRMFAEGDAVAFSEAVGFPPKPNAGTDWWFAKLPPVFQGTR